MWAFMDSISDKEGWTLKVFVDEIVAKWYAELREKMGLPPVSPVSLPTQDAEGAEARADSDAACNAGEVKEPAFSGTVPTGPRQRATKTRPTSTGP